MGKLKDKPKPLVRLDDVRFKIERQGKMNTDGLVFIGDELVDQVRNDPCLQQLANVAQLPGIVGPAMAMPDIHWGYGFPIGGVAAFDLTSGIVSPGGVGFDINCGVRLLRSNLAQEQIASHVRELIEAIFSFIPCGVGSKNAELRLGERDLERVLLKGAGWCLSQGYGEDRDLSFIESQGAVPDARPDLVSQRARKRGAPQLGTLGSGNHFCEIGVVDQVFHSDAAEAFGLREGTITFLIHTGSRGLGHQVCDESLPIMLEASRRYGIDLPDPQLCSAPIDSPEGQNYLGAMAAAANFAFANRQLITDRLRQAVQTVLRMGPRDLGMDTVYDVAHNIAKLETHQVDGRPRRLCVHRKGATRALPPGHPEVPEDYRHIGQPVLVPGDMGRYSFVLAGTKAGFAESFGSTCHGAGRLMSRGAAKKEARHRDIVGDLKKQGILVQAASRATINEEMPEAYKDVAQVVEVVERAKLAVRVVRLKPIGVVKG